MSENMFTTFNPIESPFNLDPLKPDEKIQQMKSYYEQLGMTPNKYLQEYFNSSDPAYIEHPFIDSPKESIDVRQIIETWTSKKNPKDNSFIGYSPTKQHVYGEYDFDTSNYKFSPETLQKSKQFIDFFVEHGYTKAQAAGIVGNLHAESALITHRKQMEGGPGYGLAQWENPRQLDFERVMGKNIRDSSELDQLNFILWELKNTEKSANQALLQATTPEEAAEIFAKKYERMKTYNRKREFYARRFYN